MSIFCWILIISSLLDPVISGIYTKQTIQEKQEKYDKYAECLESRQQSTVNGNRLFKGLSIARGSAIQLKCFECLSPDEEDDVEEIWKPNDSFIGRTIKLLKDKLSSVLQKLAGMETKEAAKTTFDWEFMAVKKESNWKSLINLHEPVVASARAKKVVDSFMKKMDSSYEIGDHFELEMVKADHFKHSGFYRCLRKNKDFIKIEQFYHVDVLTEIPVKVSQVDGVFDAFVYEGVAEKVVRRFEGYGVVAVLRTSNWGYCNKCGPEMIGEQRRRIECAVKAIPEAVEKLSKSRFQFMLIFESVPCSSSLLPVEMRNELNQIDTVTVEEFRQCASVCPIEKNETRVVKEVDENGREIIKDELPPNEYSLYERLPPLKPTVVRKTFREIEGDSLILDCGVNYGDILWRKDFMDLTSENMLKDSDSPRRHINFHGQLVFSKLTMEDAGFYSCLSVPKQLLRTFHVYVSESNRTAEIISWVQIGIRYCTGLLIAVLVCRVVLNTNTNAENHQRLQQRKAK